MFLTVSFVDIRVHCVYVGFKKCRLTSNDLPPGWWHCLDIWGLLSNLDFFKWMSELRHTSIKIKFSLFISHRPVCLVDGVIFRLWLPGKWVIRVDVLTIKIVSECVKSQRCCRWLFLWPYPPVLWVQYRAAILCFWSTATTTTTSTMETMKTMMTLVRILKRVWWICIKLFSFFSITFNGPSLNKGRETANYNHWS